MSQLNQTIEAILNHANKKLETLKTSNIFSQGAVQASKEIIASFVEYLAKRRDEYSNLVQQGKMTADVANLMLSQFRNVTLFLEDKHKDYEKINYIKQGELISINAQVNEFQSLLKEINKPIDPPTDATPVVQQPPAISSMATPMTDQVQVETESKSKESPSTVTVENQTAKKRPDETDTRIGRAAQDIKNRRKEAQNFSMKEMKDKKKSPGRPKK